MFRVSVLRGHKIYRGVYTLVPKLNFRTMLLEY
jgi:hypothetical protein